MDTLAISVTQQAGGLTFSLSPLVRRQLHELFPDVNILPSIFIAHTAQQQAAGLLERLAKHIVPALTGLSERQLAHFHQIAFIDTNAGSFLGEYAPQNAAA
ncbi:hypothetical protein [uncultured Hymenobacter sp.]|uniref:hypothetical protein n=1 Tax=uncultured Hymenobacter sp. TaxID=170016 RepID=UPI0035CAD856